MTTTLLLAMLLAVLAMHAQHASALMNRSTIEEHVPRGRYSYIKTALSLPSHFADRHTDRIRPLTFSFTQSLLDDDDIVAGAMDTRTHTLTLDLWVDYELFAMSSPQLLRSLDVTQFLRGSVRGAPGSTAQLHLHHDDNGMDGSITIPRHMLSPDADHSETETEMEKLRFETIVEHNGDFSGEVIIYRQRDKYVPEHLLSSGCGCDHSYSQASGRRDRRPQRAVTTEGTVKHASLAVARSLPSWLGLSAHKVKPGYKGHSSLDVLRQTKAWHAGAPAKWHNESHAADHVYRALQRRRQTLRKRDASGDAKPKTNELRMALVVFVVTPDLMENYDKMKDPSGRPPKQRPVFNKWLAQIVSDANHAFSKLKFLIGAARIVVSDYPTNSDHHTVLNRLTEMHDTNELEFDKKQVANVHFLTRGSGNQGSGGVLGFARVRCAAFCCTAHTHTDAMVA